MFIAAQPLDRTFKVGFFQVFLPSSVSEWVSYISQLPQCSGLLSTSERELLFPCAGVCVMKVKVILPLSRSLSLAER